MSFSKAKRGKLPFESARSKRRSAEKEARKKTSAKVGKKEAKESDNTVTFTTEPENSLVVASDSCFSSSAVSTLTTSPLPIPPAESKPPDPFLWTNVFGHALMAKTSFYVGAHCLESKRYCEKCKQFYNCKDDDEAERRSRAPRHRDLSLCVSCSYVADPVPFGQYVKMDDVLHEICDLYTDDDGLATAHLRHTTLYGKNA